jgi:hypothetical protein
MAPVVKQKPSTSFTPITRFIGKALCKRKFRPPGVRTEGGSEGGCALGSATDTIVGKCIKAHKLPNVPGIASNYALRFFAEMRRNGFPISGFQEEGVQLTVFYPQLQLQARLDAIAIDRKGVKHVIELKTTQHTLQQHLASYKVAFPSEPTLVNGVENTLYNRHQLQCGFQTMCIQRDAGVNETVHGLVVVVCRQVGVESAVALYPVTNRVKMMNPKTYNIPHRSANLSATLSSRAAPKSIRWPQEDSPAMNKLTLQLFKRNVNIVKVKKKYHAGANYKIFAMSKSTHAVYIIVNKSVPKYKGSVVRRGQMELVRVIASMHQTASKCKTSAHLINLDSNGNWQKETITKRHVV